MTDKFKKLPLYYQNMVNWEKRLLKEGPFIKKILRDAGVRRVLDCGCGNGRHVIYLRREGFEADGADTSPWQLDLARQEAEKTGVIPQFFLEDMTCLDGIEPGKYQGIINIGNSMASLGPDKARMVLENFFRLLPPGGLAMVHVLNFHSFGRQDRTEIRRARVEGREMVFLKTFHFRNELAVVVVNLLEKTDDGEWDVTLNTADMHYLDMEFFRDASIGAGFDRVEFYGGLDGSVFDLQESRDLVAVFFK